MKKAILLILVLVMILTGCGAKTEPTPAADPAPAAADPTPAATTEPTATEPAASADPTPAADPEPVPTDGPGMMADVDLVTYMEFIEGNVPCVFAKDALGEGSTGDSYFINELVMATSSYFAADDLSAYFHSANYAYIDCGNDEVKELALQINLMPTEDSEYYDLTQFFIFKYLDGEVKLVGSDWGYYRSWVTLNPYGIMNYTGSNGAASYFMDITFVDADGNEQFFYSVDCDMGMAEPGVGYYDIPDSLRPADYPYIEMAGSDTDYYCSEAYSFEPYNMYTVDEEYMMNRFFRFTDADDNDAEPSDELKAVYEEIGLKWYDTDTVDAMMNERMVSFGLTEEMLSDMSEPEWIEIDFE